MRNLTTAVIVAIASSGCAITLDADSTPPEHLSRRAIDADTNEAIAGAYVIFSWWETRADLSQSSTRCARKEFRITDSGGSVTLPTWRGTYPIVAEVYKPGMVRVRSNLEKQGIEVLRRSRINGNERLREMLVTAGRFRCEGGADGFVPLYESMLSEAKLLQTPQSDQKMMDSFEIARDSAKYGHEEAYRIHHERVMARVRDAQ